MTQALLLIDHKLLRPVKLAASFGPCLCLTRIFSMSEQQDFEQF